MPCLLLPPAPGLCHLCAADHPPEAPHNKASVYYVTRFCMKYGRAPTWADAIAHCDETVRRWAIGWLCLKDLWTDADNQMILDNTAIAEPTLYTS